MKLLGVFEKNSGERLILQNKNLFSIENTHDVEEKFANYTMLKNRDKHIGSKAVKGNGVFNFRYGPVTGGVGDAGVFNIYTYGERILSVDIDPGYKKRNIEASIKNSALHQAVNWSENVCSNFAFSHSCAFLRAVEDAGDFMPDEITQRIRIVGVELERIYNHLNVISRLSKGASQNVLTSHLEWLFEEALRANKLFSNSRFLKHINGLFIDKDNFKNLDELVLRIKNIKEKFQELYEHSLASWNFIDRLYETAVLDQKKALKIGVTGPTLRAAGCREDLRVYEKFYDNFKIITKDKGDVLARMQVRADETVSSCDIVIDQIDKIKKIQQNNSKIAVSAISGSGIGYCESPSGLVVYFVNIEKGIVSDVYISTPSVFGFKAFADSFVGYIFTDFSFSFDSFGINFADCAR